MILSLAYSRQENGERSFKLQLAVGPWSWLWLTPFG